MSANFARYARRYSEKDQGSICRSLMTLEHHGGAEITAQESQLLANFIWFLRSQCVSPVNQPEYQLTSLDAHGMFAHGLLVISEGVVNYRADMTALEAWQAYRALGRMGLTP